MARVVTFICNDASFEKFLAIVPLGQVALLHTGSFHESRNLCSAPMLGSLLLEAEEVTIRLQPVCPFLREGPRSSAGVRGVWPQARPGWWGGLLFGNFLLARQEARNVKMAKPFPSIMYRLPR